MHVFFAVDHPLCDVLNQKTQNLIAHQKEGIDQTQKSFLAAKKRGFRGFRTYFLLLTTPYVMFEIKKFKLLLLIRRKE